jgi:23S rRNA (uracil1939-C5)-methyltransferase
MVSIYQTKKKNNLPQHGTVTVQRWDHAAQGISSHQGNICFVEGALPGEQVQVRFTEQKKDYSRAVVQKVIQASALRVKAPCPSATQCGGCQLQYVAPASALELKQAAVDALLQHQLKLSALPWQPALAGTANGYRRKARIGIWFDKASQQFQVGFRKIGSKEILDVPACMVLSPVIAPVLGVLRQTLPQLKHGSAITHAEVLDADGHAFIVIRHIRPLPDTDKALLTAAWPQAFWLGEPQTGEFAAWQAQTPQPSYALSAGQKLEFDATDFIQVNGAINQAMVSQAVAWLMPEKSDQVLDLYCGIGNFSLALAPFVAAVTGVEGISAMVQRARDNAQLNGYSNCTFAQADLHLSWQDQSWNQPVYQKVLLDPARAGALGAVDALVKLKPAQILYVSCDPATFARDAKVLLANRYSITKIGVMDMFPYTSHLELMALFELKK